MATRNLSIRLSVKDAEIVRRALEGLGEDGQRALKRLDSASREASRGTLALNDAMGEVRGTMQGYANQLGPLGAGLTALGPAGLAAAAGIGAVVLGLGAAMREAKEAVNAFDQVAKTADRLGVSTDALQELRFAADLAGVSTQTLDMALQRFTRRAAEAAQGTGEAKDALAQLGITLTDANGNLRPAEDLLGDVADALAAIESPAERVRIAFKLFDSEGVAMVNMLGDGSKALDDMRRQARDLGLVIEEDVLRNAEEMNDKLSIASQVIDTKLKVAFIELAPIIAEVTEAIAGMARGITDLLARFKDVEDVSTRALESRLADVRGQIEENNRLIDRLAPDSGYVRPAHADEQRQQIIEENRRLHAQAVEYESELARRQGEAPLKIDVPVPYDPGDERPPPPQPKPGALEIIDLRSPWETRTPPIPLPKGMTREQVESEQRAFEAARKALADYDEQMRQFGETVRQEVMTPAEELDARLAELNEAHRVGAIDAETFGRATSAAWEDFGSASETAVEQVDRASDVAHDLGLTFSSAFEDAIANGAEFSEVLKGIEQDLIRLATRELITEPLLGAATDLFGGLFGGGGGGRPGVSSGGGLGGMFASLFHDGGVAGGPAPMRAVSPDVFRDAPRLHSGGAIGLRGDEVPAILQRGEVVLPRGGAAVAPVNINIVNNSGAKVDVQQSNGGRQIDVVIDEMIAGAIRSGGRTTQALRQMGVRPNMVAR